jgi:cell division protein FtsB
VRTTRHLGAERRQRQRSIAGVLAAIAAAAGLGLFYLSQSTHVAAVGYEIDTLQAQIAALKADQQQLVLEIGAARAPNQILQHATRDLGLVPLDSKQVTFAVPRGAAAASPSPDTTK